METLLANLCFGCWALVGLGLFYTALDRAVFSLLNTRTFIKRDNKTEEEIVDQIRRLKGQITTIIIAHRHSTIEHCDKIYRLEQGKLVQEGSPQIVLTEFHSSKN